MVQELDYGPNGGLVFAMEYLSENMNWLEALQLDELAPKPLTMRNAVGRAFKPRNPIVFIF